MSNIIDNLYTIPTDANLQSRLFNTTEADLFFINTAYFDAYLQLLEGIRQHSGLLVLTSDPGIGKTLLLRKLVHEAPARIKFAFYYSTSLDFNELLAVISDQLGIPADKREGFDRIKTLKEYLNMCATQKIDVALLIDDAHHLREDVLSSLLTLSHSEFKEGHLLQIVLSGTPVLEEILARMQIFHAYLCSAVHIRLEPLAADDVAAFISLQAQRADDPAVDPIFSPLVVERVIHYTGGIPRLIETLCKRALLIMQLDEQTTVSMAIIDEAASELMLQSREIAIHADALPVSLEATQPDSTAQRVETTLSSVQDASPLLSETATQSPAIRSLAVDPAVERPSRLRRWDDLQATRPHHRLFHVTRDHVALLGLLALLAGLLGGAASIYLYPLLPARIPVAARMEPLAPAPPQTAIKIQPVSVGVTPAVIDKAEVSSSKTPVESSPAPASSETSSLSDYMRNGQLWLTRGDIVSARLFYEAAANTGFAEAMTAVGRTYDPVVLSQLGVKGFHADPVKAADWYLKAAKAGDPESAERLNGLRHLLSDSRTPGGTETTALQKLLR